MHLPFRVGVSTHLGIRGVIATEIIPPDTIIEQCPVILYPSKQEPVIDQTILSNYVFYWTLNYDCFVLGYGAVINHSFTPNAIYTRNYLTKEMIFKSLKTINKDEEITVNYNGDPHSQDPLDPAYLSSDDVLRKHFTRKKLIEDKKI